MFGFDESINPAHTEGESMHPVVWNITALDARSETRIAELVKKAA